MDLNLSFDLRVEPLNKYTLDAPTMLRLREGDIVALDDQYTFIQRILAVTMYWPLARSRISIFSIKCACWTSR